MRSKWVVTPSSLYSLTNVHRQLRQKRALSDEVGGFAKGIDKALSGEHMRTLYDARTDAAGIRCSLAASNENDVVQQIPTQDRRNVCDCGNKGESIEHILCRCGK